MPIFQLKDDCSGGPNFIETVLSRATHFNTPNKETIEAMEELKRGEGLKFDSVDSLFESI